MSNPRAIGFSRAASVRALGDPSGGGRGANPCLALPDPIEPTSGSEVRHAQPFQGFARLDVDALGLLMIPTFPAHLIAGVGLDLIEKLKGKADRLGRG